MSAEATAAPAEEKKTGLLGKPLVLGVLLLVVMAAEAGVFLLLLPAPAHTESAEEEHGDGHGGGGHGGHGASDEGHDTVEVIVDTFSTTNSKAAPGATVHLTFKLTAVVPSGQDVAFEHAANQAHKAQVRDSVIRVARSARLEDLSDPALTTLKRQLREEINKVLKKSYVSEVAISEFKVMEQ
jgi:flagellar basal body-associated protein FliL